MPLTLKNLYFRVRENGAQVFRVDTENRQQRLELDPIAVVNIRNGEIKPQRNQTLTEAEHADIAKWMEHRRSLVEQRDTDDMLRVVDQLNLTTQWVQNRATPEQINAVTGDLLMAMHDLRNMIVKKQSEQFAKQQDSDDDVA